MKLLTVNFCTWIARTNKMILQSIGEKAFYWLDPKIKTMSIWYLGQHLQVKTKPHSTYTYQRTWTCTKSQCLKKPWETSNRWLKLTYTTYAKKKGFPIRQKRIVGYTTIKQKRQKIISVEVRFWNWRLDHTTVRRARPFQNLWQLTISSSRWTQSQVTTYIPG